MLALQKRGGIREWQPLKTCAQIPIDLHERVSEERERLGQTTSEYIANLIQEYYDMIENQKGGIQMTEKGRTMAFRFPKNSSSASSA